MRRTGIFVFATVVAVLFLAGGSICGIAGVNPRSPGLPTAQYPNDTNRYANNAFSAMCVDCHGRNPVAATTAAAYGSHFVSYGPALAGTAATSTNTSGGWGVAATDSQRGALDNGAYVRISPWLTGVTSKYGRVSDNASISYDNTGNHTGLVDTTVGDYKTAEIICESCHNVVKNAAGGNNLVAEPVLQSDAKNDNTAAAAIPNVCVGCHGDMYSLSSSGTGNDNAAAGATHQAKYQSERNRNESEGLSSANRKGVQSIHTIAGAVYGMNHHVTTGDGVHPATVGVGLAWRDTTVISANAEISTVSNASTIGQMPQIATWSTDKAKVSSGGVNCINCHAQGHGGNKAVAASILRDDDTTNGALLGNAPTAVNGVERLGENGRKWFDFNDKAFCYDCHLKP